MNRLAVFVTLAAPLSLLAACGGTMQSSGPQSGASEAAVRIEATYWIPTPAPPTAVPSIAPTVPAEPPAESTAASMQLAPTEAPAPTAAPTQILPQPTATPAAAPPNADASIDALRDELLQLHNQARATQNLPPYTVSPQLQQAAQAHAEWLAQKPITELLSLGAQAHTGENNSTFQARIAAAGYPGRATNESFGAFATPKEAFDWWQGDEWHRPQIFSTEYRGIGFGVVRHPSGKAMVFIVTFGDS